MPLKETPVEAELDLLKELDKYIDHMGEQNKAPKRIALSASQMDKVYQMLRRKTQFPAENAGLELGKVDTGVEYRGLILYKQ